MVCGFSQLHLFSAASTFWPYVNNLGISQANSFLNIMSIFRERVRQQYHLEYQKIHVSADTTGDKVYGSQQDARKRYTPQHLGKSACRPILCFMDETREYLIDKLRKGSAITREVAATIIKKIRAHLPGCLKKILFQGDEEFFLGTC
jgi:hypothetical protein